MFLTNWIAVTIPLYVAEGIDALALGDAGIPVLQSSARWVAVLGVLGIGIRTGSRVLFFTPGRMVEAQVKHDLFERILHHQPSFLSTWPTGDLTSRVTSDTNMLRMLSGFATLGIINTISALLLTGSQMVRISPTLAALAAIPLLGAFGTIQFFMRQMHQIMRELQRVTGELSNQALTSYQGVATIQLFGASEAFSRRFEEQNNAYLKNTLRRANLRTVFGPVLTLGTALNVFLLLRYGGMMTIEGTLSTGEMVAFIALVAYLTGPLRGMSFIIAIAKQAQASLERIDKILYQDPDRPDLPEPLPPPSSPPSLRVDGLDFTYPGEDSPTLQGIQFTLPAGKTLGIFGATGSGKTTLLRLLARLHNPSRGQIYVNDTDILDIDLDGWREQMTLVPQRAYLFSESIRDNVLLGRHDGPLLQKVLTLAALGPDIEALPEGVDTSVGEAGVTLSGGQRQRTAIARGLARTHSVLMLDDVLSAVDQHTEALLISTLRALNPTPTTVLVAHRLRALQHADLIIVLEQGHLTHSGTHEQLLTSCERYRDTWIHQQDGDDDGV